MGSGESKPLPPWQDDAEQDYPDPIKHKIQQITTHANVFLCSNPAYYHSFELEDHLPRLQGAFTFDENISKWLPKLVPKKVSEQEFWRNYFSHIQAIVREGDTQFVVNANNKQDAAASTHTNNQHNNTTARLAEVPAASTAASNAAAAAAAAAGGSIQQASGVTPSPITKTSTHVHTAAANAHQPQTADTRPTPSTIASQPFEQEIAVPWSLSALPLPRNAAYLSPTELASLSNTQHVVRFGIIASANNIPHQTIQAIRMLPNAHIKAIGILSPHVVRQHCDRPLPQGASDIDHSHNKVNETNEWTEPQLRKVYEEVAHTYEITKVYNDYTALIEDGEVDIVYIATPAGTHLRYGIETCQHQKSCIIDRPMGRNSEESRVLADTFFSASIPLFINNHLRWTSKLWAAKQALSAIGKIHTVHYECRAVPQTNASSQHHSHLYQFDSDARVNGGSSFVQIGSDFFDALDFLFSASVSHVLADAIHLSSNHQDTAAQSTNNTTLSTAPTSSSSSSHSQVENLLNVMFRLPNSNGLGTATFDFVSGHSHSHSDVLFVADQFVATGDQGQVSFSLFGQDAPKSVVAQTKASWNIKSQNSTNPAVASNQQLPYISQVVEEFLAWRHNLLKVNMLSGVLVRHAVNVSVLIDSCLRNYYRSRQDEFWKRPHTWSKPS